jgi:choline dehydrogenase-like flavoprotein
MFTDTRDVSTGSTLRADVCVVGGGAAGIALAIELADTPLSVVLLEGGGLAEEADGPGIHRVVPDPLGLVLDPTKTGYLGGNTNYWAGNNLPLREVDLAPRDWIPHSGWPIDLDELLPFYERAQPMSGLSDFRWYDLDACRPHLEHPPIEVDPSVLTHRIMQTCPVLSFADLHRHVLEVADNVKIVLHARALRLMANSEGDHVDAVEFAGADGRRSRVEAGMFVLATGGVENARLLLCSNDARSRGLGNERDLVGRFFMEHWYFDIGLGDWGAGADLVLYGGRQTVGGADIWAQLALSDEIMRAERVPGINFWFQPMRSTTPGVHAVSRIADFARGRERLEHPLTDLRLVLSDPGEAGRYLRAKLGRRGSGTVDGYVFRVQVEQTPDPENRVRLSSTQDRFGQPQAELALRLAEGERESHVRSVRIAADAVGLSGSRLAKQMRLMFDAGLFSFFWHHMGTTRMHDDPFQGVVDSDCRVHGVSNLFVAGSSVFPTGGNSAPTLTIVALALRLADHIRHVQSGPSVSVDASARV